MGDSCSKEDNYTNYSDFNMLQSSEYGQAQAKATISTRKEKLNSQDALGMLTPPRANVNKDEFALDKKIQLSDRSEQKTSNV